MPIKKVCAKQSCGRLVESSDRYCDKHYIQATMDKRDRNRCYDKNVRDKNASSFYHSKQWQSIRKQRLVIDNYLCQDCLDEYMFKAADVVDHIKPIEHFWELRLTSSNLRSLCHMHHNRKTAEDKKKYGGNKT